MYITGYRAISPQATYDENMFDGLIKHTGNKYKAIEPNYTGLITPNLFRRMGKSIRIGIGAGVPLIQNKTNIEGIILGSSEGGLEDCIKFLNQIVQYEEGTLSPTNFIQSTPNSLAGNLAIMSKNNCYNITHVHKGHAFENALIDALMLIYEGNATSLLVGNVEEISDYNFNIETLAGQFKNEETDSENLLTSNSEGTVCGEGTCMFVLEAKPTKYYAHILDVTQTTNPSEQDMHELITKFLTKNNLTPQEIDSLILGYNGDNRTDFWYENVRKTLFPKQPIFTYKNLVGEYPTSIGFAMFMATEILCGKNLQNKTSIQAPNSINNILIYNHYKGVQHGLILISKV